MRRSQAINLAGAAATALVLVLVLVTKFVHGAYIVVIAMPLLYLLMVRIRRHYDAVDVEAAPRPGGVVLPSRIHAVVPVVRVNEPTLRTLAFARAIHPDDLTAVTVRVDPVETDQLIDRVGAPRHPGAADRRSTARTATSPSRCSTTSGPSAGSRRATSSASSSPSTSSGTGGRPCCTTRARCG